MRAASSFQSFRPLVRTVAVKFGKSFQKDTIRQFADVKEATSIVLKLDNGLYRTISKAGVYEGELQNNKEHGVGKITLPSGRTVEGTFQDGTIAFGKTTLGGGDTYEGELKNYQPHGKGKIFTAQHGMVGEGEFQNGALNGPVIFRMPNGGTIEHIYKGGRPLGNVKLTERDGSSFEGLLHNSGQFRVNKGDNKKGEESGKCKITYPDGTVIEGDFRNGELNGQGKITMPDGATVEGRFRNHKLHGKGKLDIFGAVTEGYFEDGKLSGQGKIVTEEGTVYAGKFKENCVFGKIKITHLDGTVVKGEYREGRFVGSGKVTFRSGHIFEGTLFNAGKVTYPDGVVCEANFDEGRRLCVGEHRSAIVATLSEEQVQCMERLKSIGKTHLRVKVVNSSGQTIISTSEKGQFEGWTTLIHSDGAVTKGTQVNGRWHGVVRVVTPAGDIVEGVMEHGVKEGNWTSRLPSGEVEGTVIYRNGNPT
eukprot:gene9992-11712_t